MIWEYHGAVVEKWSRSAQLNIVDSSRYTSDSFWYLVSRADCLPERESWIALERSRLKNTCLLSLRCSMILAS